MISPGAEPRQNQPEPRDVEIEARQFDDGLGFGDIFENAHPVEIEIGSGRGRFLIASARTNPSVNYIGIERAYKFFHVMKERVQQAGLHNVRLLRAEADYFIRAYVPAGSVQAFHIYFPDPWPKTKHHKRRLITPDFFTLLRSRLLPGGSIHLATDFAPYFEIMLKTGRGCAGLEELYCRRIDSAGLDPETAATNYERRFFMHGLKICRAAYKKTGAAAP